jgi:hypothetical protein
VPLREAPIFAATPNTTDPFPVPLAPDVIVIHGAPLVAVHVHVLPVVTATVPDPPSATKFWLVGEIEYVHGGGTIAA